MPVLLPYLNKSLGVRCVDPIVVGYSWLIIGFELKLLALIFLSLLRSLSLVRSPSWHALRLLFFGLLLRRVLFELHLL